MHHYSRMWQKAFGKSYLQAHRRQVPHSDKLKSTSGQLCLFSGLTTYNYPIQIQHVTLFSVIILSLCMRKMQEGCTKFLKRYIKYCLALVRINMARSLVTEHGSGAGVLLMPRDLVFHNLRVLFTANWQLVTVGRRGRAFNSHNVMDHSALVCFDAGGLLLFRCHSLWSIWKCCLYKNLCIKAKAAVLTKQTRLFRPSMMVKYSKNYRKLRNVNMTMLVQSSSIICLTSSFHHRTLKSTVTLRCHHRPMSSSQTNVL